ncbi:MAG: anaerobic ribonucleoside-triphosphate reductase activating protein [Ignavibacteria bacterium]|jgi:pyruvate formate lyase activating enzyme
MKIAGFQKVSLIDYPGKISTVIFTQGCNFRCGYCHNPQLVLPELFEQAIDEQIIFDYLSERKGKIEGVVITGGEPTIHKDLPGFIYKVKQKGFLVKLDTNGSNPQMLKSLLEGNMIDFVAMDVKTTLSKYNNVSGVEISEEKLRMSINLIKNSSVEKQFRITLIRGIHERKDLSEIEKIVGNKITLQFFTYTGNHISKSFDEHNTFKEEEKKSF